MEELETLERFECPECPGPPPEFRLPPPPRPPFLTEGTFCPETIPDLEDCGAFPMIDPSYHTNPSLQSTALIITCAVVLLLMAAIVSVVFWKHKRKVQNLLPCKSAAGAAAAAGRGRVLPDGQPLPGSGSTGSAVLYEDLPESGGLPQLHNHLTSHTGQPTIEVRGTNPQGQQRKRERVPAPHHLDYLDYRDPRAILRVADKPSRAVLGGYRTPRALLAKSQAVPLSIATHAPRNNPVPSPHLLRNNHLLLANQNALITSHSVFLVSQPVQTDFYESGPAQPPNNLSNYASNNSNNNNNNSNNDDTPSHLDPAVSTSPYHAINDVPVSNLSVRAHAHKSGDPITPTHRPRIGTPTFSHGPRTSGHNLTAVPRLANDTPPRRPSVDSEGYSYIDFDDNTRLGGVRIVDSIPSRECSIRGSTTTPGRTLLATSRSNSIDSEGYSYIDPMYRRLPGVARRIPINATDEEVCPLCTMQQIQHLLTRPKDAYSDNRGS